MILSIITINRNNSEGLRMTIDSVLAQSFTQFEFIVIDGASSDSSLEVIEQYKDKIDYWISEKDTGVYNAMNKGIKQAKGKYLHFLNAGDYLAHNDVLKDIFDKERDASFICGNFTSEKSGIRTNENPYKNRDWTFSIYDIYSGDLCHQAFYIKADNFEKYGLYDDSLKISADWLLFFIAIGINHESVDYVDTNIVVYNTEGMSSTIGGEFIYKERKEAARKHISSQLSQKLDRLYYLEQNSYITDNIKGNRFLFFLFRAYCKIGRSLGFIKE